jgi:hypothetical protein
MLQSGTDFMHFGKESTNKLGTVEKSRDLSSFRKGQRNFLRIGLNTDDNGFITVSIHQTTVI